jgi:hypothetical protein
MGAEKVNRISREAEIQNSLGRSPRCAKSRLALKARLMRFARSPFRRCAHSEFFSSPVVAPDEVKYSARLCTDGSELPPLFRRVSWLF